MTDYYGYSEDDLNPCARCLHPRHKERCKMFHVDRNRFCGCPRYIKMKKSFQVLRLMTCPFKVHFKAVMIPIREFDDGSVEYQCPRCKKRTVI